MRLDILGSSSAGNGYVIQNGQEAIIIEAGIHLSEVKKALEFNNQKVACCLISHSHNDHAGHIKNYLKAGIRILAGEDVFQAKGIPTNAGYNITTVTPQRGYRVGNFRIVPFELYHDVPCKGYLVDHPECGSFVFITDTYTCDYTFPDLTQVMIECNYADDILERNIITDRISPSMRPRLYNSHMELETTKSFLQENDLSGVNNIILLHLSDSNSNEVRFVREVQEMTGKTVHAAKGGISIEFNKQPF